MSTPQKTRRKTEMDNNKLDLVFTVEKDTKNTRRYKEDATDGPPVIPCLWQTGTLRTPRNYSSKPYTTRKITYRICGKITLGILGTFNLYGFN